MIFPPMVDKGGDWLCLNGSNDVFTGIGNTVATLVGFFRLLLGVIRAYKNKVSIVTSSLCAERKTKTNTPVINRQI